MLGLKLKLGNKAGGGTSVAATPLVNTKSMVLTAGEYLRVTDHASLDFTTALTVSAWVKASAGGIGAGIISKDDYGASQRSFDMFQDTSNQAKFSGFVSGSGSNTKWLISSITCFDNTWHHIAFTFAPNALKLYVDGVLDPSPNTSNASTTVNSIHVGTADLTMGCILNSNVPSPYVYSGYIDEPSLWNATLTDAEIAEIYNDGVPTDLTAHSKAANLVSWWRMGDDAGDSITSILDQVGSNDATPTNMESEDIIEDAP